MAESESDDRTAEGSKRRRQQAKEQGHAPQSRELTSAVGMLAIVVLLGAMGENLASALVELVRLPLSLAARGSETSSDHFRSLFVKIGGASFAALAWSCMIGGGALLATLLAQQLQTGGLWAPARLGIDFTRLWTGASTQRGSSAHHGWSLGRLTLGRARPRGRVILDGQRIGALRLSELQSGALARSTGSLLQQMGLTLALTWLALGLFDYTLAPAVRGTTANDADRTTR